MPDRESFHESVVLERLDEVTVALSGIRDVLDQEEAVGRVLQRGVDQITRAIPSAALASVTVIRGNDVETVACSSERALTIDSDQYAAGDGPCQNTNTKLRELAASVVAGARRLPRSD